MLFATSQSMLFDVDSGETVSYLAMSNANVSMSGDAAFVATPPVEMGLFPEWQPAQPKTSESSAPCTYGAPTHKRLELVTMEPTLSPTTTQRAARRAAKARGGPGVLTKQPVRVEWCVQPRTELPAIPSRQRGGLIVTSTPLEELPTADQVDDCLLAEHYTPCGTLRTTAPHAASQLHVHKLSSMLVMVKTVRLGELQTARQRHRAVTEWRLLRALQHRHIARLVHVMSDTAVEGPTLSGLAETLLLVHEYCAGGSLEAYVKRYGALQEQLAKLTPTLHLTPNLTLATTALTSTPPLTLAHPNDAGEKLGAHRRSAHIGARPLPRAAGR